MKKLKTKTIKVTLQACGDHNGKYCFIKVKQPKSRTVDSETRDDCVMDYDKQGNLTGIELYNGFELKKK
jgi:uncharacterized protein YuzE